MLRRARQPHAMLRELLQTPGGTGLPPPATRPVSPRRLPNARTGRWGVLFLSVCVCWPGPMCLACARVCRCVPVHLLQKAELTSLSHTRTHECNQMGFVDGKLLLCARGPGLGWVLTEAMHHRPAMNNQPSPPPGHFQRLFFPQPWAVPLPQPRAFEGNEHAALRAAKSCPE